MYYIDLSTANFIKINTKNPNSEILNLYRIFRHLIIDIMFFQIYSKAVLDMFRSRNRLSISNREGTIQLTGNIIYLIELIN